MKILTDEQCDEFRRLPVSFNDMVRAIYEAGRNQALEDTKSMVRTVYKEIDIPIGLCSRHSYEHGWRGASWEIGERLEAMKAI